MNSGKTALERWVFFSMILLGILSLNPDVPAQRSFPQNPRMPNMAPPQPSKSAVLKMRVVEGEVTAEISDCPLHSVLKELAERTGIIFEVRSEPNPLVAVKLYGIPLRDAIPRIAVNSDIIFFYDESKPGGITMVRVLPRTKSVQQPGIFYLGSGAITKTGMEIE